MNYLRRLRPRFSERRFAGIVPALAIAVGLAGCATWSARPKDQLAASDTRAQVWRKSGMIVLDKMTISADSIVGQGPGAPGIRVAIVRTDVDSVRVERTDAGKVVIVGAALAIVAYFARFGGWTVGN